MGGLDAMLSDKLTQRSSNGLLRSLRVADGKVDFCSNDYLGFSRDPELRRRIREVEELWEGGIGSTGSRLLSGHSAC
jgi:8-amino-7-oxononanoate synthase